MAFDTDRDEAALPEPTLDRSEWVGIARRHRAGESVGRIAQSFNVEPAEIMAILRQNPLTMRADAGARRAAGLGGASSGGPAPQAAAAAAPTDHAAALEATLKNLTEAYRQGEGADLRGPLDEAWQRLRDIEAAAAGGKAGRR